jgi:multidrug resistance efflux pump
LAAAAAKVHDAEANLANERAQTDRILQLVTRDFASRAQGDQARAKLPTSEGALQEARANEAEARKRLGPTNQEAMRVRRETVEHPFGTMKARMGATHFLTKTLPKVATEICSLTT